MSADFLAIMRYGNIKPIRSKEDEKYYKQCSSKVRHDTEAQAERVALKNNFNSKKDHPVKPYHCGYCDGWHNGGF